MFDSFVAAFLLIGFFYFILIRAISTKNYIRKSLFILIGGIFITIIFIIGRIIDIDNPLPYPNGKFDLEYYAYLIVSTAFMIAIPLIYFVKGKKRRQRFKSGFTKIKSTPTIKNKKEFLYIIIKYNNNFLLEKHTVDNKDIYKGIVIKFPRNEFFHDELINEFIEKKDLSIDSYKFIGKAINDKKVEEIYYCYKVLVNEINESILSLNEIDSYKLLSIELSDFDKKIAYTK